MKSWHLNILMDPADKSPLHLTDASMEGDEIISGWLESKSNRYPITNGIPRFVGNQGYSSNFGFQWTRWPMIQFESENLHGPMAGWTDRMFRLITVSQPTDFEKKLVLDLGCGPGRFADRVIEYGGVVVGVDYSSAIDIAKANLGHMSPESLWIQADALKLPIRDSSIDAGYSIGVLHHTPNPSLGVREAARVLKSESRFSLSVYPKGGFYGWPTVRFLRFLLNLFPENVKHCLALTYSTILCTLLQPLGNIWIPLTYPIRLFFPTIYLPDLRWAILDTFDSITTRYQSTHTSSEVKQWFSQSGLIRFKDGAWGEGNVTGQVL